jgi:hypothetical protein
VKVRSVYGRRTLERVMDYGRLASRADQYGAGHSRLLGIQTWFLAMAYSVHKPRSLKSGVNHRTVYNRL